MPKFPTIKIKNYLLNHHPKTLYLRHQKRDLRFSRQFKNLVVKILNNRNNKKNINIENNQVA